MLQRWLMGVGALLILLGVVVLILAPVTIAGALKLYVVGELFLGGAILTAGVALERWRYRPQIDRARGHWQLTGERFVDPVSGHLTEVRFNPETGQRDYVDVGKPSS
jgi:hypothetical protein